MRMASCSVVIVRTGFMITVRRVNRGRNSNYLVTAAIRLDSSEKTSKDIESEAVLGCQRSGALRINRGYDKLTSFRQLYTCNSHLYLLYFPI